MLEDSCVEGSGFKNRSGRGLGFTLTKLGMVRVSAEGSGVDSVWLFGLQSARFCISAFGLGVQVLLVSRNVVRV